MKTLKNKLASIIIVNFNNADLLIQSLKSALNQSYKNREVIVVDDFSTDHSLKILKSFKKRIRIIRNKKKTLVGSYNQINSYYLGFLKSKGKYIFFLDSDDFYNKNKLKKVIKEFESKKNLQIIFDLPILKFPKKIKKEKFFQRSFNFSNWPRFTPQSCISLKRSYAKELFLKLKIKKFETLWFDFRIASYTFMKEKNIFVLNKYLTYYRQLENSASKEYKIFSKKWWFRRQEAHDFIDYLFKKNRLKNRITLDKVITMIVNKFLNSV